MSRRDISFCIVSNKIQTIGTVQTSFKLRFSLFGPLVKHMTFPQRLCGFVYTISSLFTVFLVLSMFTAPIVLVAGGNMVPYNTTDQLKWLIRANFLTTILNRINEFVSYLPSGYRTGQRDARAMMWMAPCKCPCNLVFKENIID